MEILFGCDADDATTMKVINNLKNKYHQHIDIIYKYRERSEWLNRDYFNWLANMARGEFCWNIGDDLVFKVQNWDKIILEKLDIYFKDKKDIDSHCPVLEAKKS